MAALLLAAYFSLFILTEGIDYTEYDQLTKAFVDDRGLVDYRGLKGKIRNLRHFVDQLAATSPENRPDLFRKDGESLRYYLTAYNAWVLYIAASEYPSKRSLWRFGLFRNRDIRLGGRASSLNEMEHDILRKQYGDPRIHFYINCAAASCPPIVRGAIPEGGTDEALYQAASRFINDQAHVRYDAKTRVLYLSKIFDWFEEDFLDYLEEIRGIKEPRIVQYVALFLKDPYRQQIAETPPGKIKIRYLKYDKSLNDQGVRY
jgi:hypothetical protein